MATPTIANFEAARQKYGAAYDQLQKSAAREGVGEHVNTLWAMAAIESSYDPTIGAGTSSAKGFWQFISGTWSDVGGGDINDPVTQADRVAILTSRNVKSFRDAVGREPTPAEVYLAHFGGAGTANKTAKAIAAGNGGESISTVMSGDQIAANSSITYNGKSFSQFTVQDLHDWSNSKFEQVSALLTGFAAGVTALGASEKAREFYSNIDNGNVDVAVAQYGSLTGRDAFTVQKGALLIQTHMGLSADKLTAAGIDTAKLEAERGLISQEERTRLEALSPEQRTTEMRNREVIVDGDNWYDLSQARVGDETKKLLKTVGDAYNAMTPEQKAEMRGKAEEEIKKQQERVRTDAMTAGGGTGQGQSDDLFGMVIAAMIAHSMGRPDIAQQIMSGFSNNGAGGARESGYNPPPGRGGGRVQTRTDDPVATARNIEELARTWDGKAVIHTLPTDAVVEATSVPGHRASPGGVGSTNHAGLDLAPRPRGSIVRATASADAVVKETGYSSGYGHYAILAFADGTTARYAHLAEAPSVKGGERVERGAPIGIIGSTGKSTGPHLHYELKSSTGAVLAPTFVGFGALSEDRNYDPAVSMAAYKELLAKREAAAVASATPPAGGQEVAARTAAVGDVLLANLDQATRAAIAGIKLDKDGNGVLSGAETAGATADQIAQVGAALRASGASGGQDASAGDIGTQPKTSEELQLALKAAAEKNAAEKSAGAAPSV